EKVAPSFRSAAAAGPAVTNSPSATSAIQAITLRRALILKFLHGAADGRGGLGAARTGTGERPRAMTAPSPFDRARGEARDVVVEEEDVHDDDGDARQQGAPHEGAPEVDVSADQVGGAPHHRRLF